MIDNDCKDCEFSECSEKESPCRECLNSFSTTRLSINFKPKTEKSGVKYATEADIYKVTIEANGKDRQLCVAMEECAELIQAISKFERYGTGETQENVAEEIADVQIMIEQLKIICNITDEHIKSYHDKKINRLKERLKVK